MVAGLREIGVQRGHHLGALADGGGHALDRAGAHVADGEYPRAARLQRMAPVAAAGPHEALRVQRDIAVREPARVGICADAEEEVADRPRRLIAACAVAPAYGC